MEGGGRGGESFLSSLALPPLALFLPSPNFCAFKERKCFEQTCGRGKPKETLAKQATVFFTKGVVFWDYSGIEIHRTIEGNR